LATSASRSSKDFPKSRNREYIHSTLDSLQYQLISHYTNHSSKIEKDYEISQQDRSTWDNDGTETALRLVGFEGPDGKPYSLVKMLQPVILVAKDDDDLAPDQRFLLSKQEADQIIPILEQEFKAELAEAGLSTAPKYESPGFE
jgi:hypothetical protein